MGSTLYTSYYSNNIKNFDFTIILPARYWILSLRQTWYDSSIRCTAYDQASSPFDCVPSRLTHPDERSSSVHWISKALCWIVLRNRMLSRVPSQADPNIVPPVKLRMFRIILEHWRYCEHASSYKQQYCSRSQTQTKPSSASFIQERTIQISLKTERYRQCLPDTNLR